jgi:chitodextrinase
MIDFMKLLARLAKLEAELQELRSRTHAIQYAQVTAIDQQRRQIKVSREVQGGQSQSSWVPAGRSNRHTDEPLPLPGTTVLVALVEGNPHDMALLRTVPNDTNPPDPNQANPENDNTTEIPGDDRTTILGNQTHGIGGDESRETDGKVNVLCNGGEYTIDIPYGLIRMNARNTITLSNAAGASVELGQTGAVTLTDAWGHKLVLGGGANGDVLQWDLNGATLDMINVGGFKLNNKQVIVVGSTDSDGDTNINRGY